MILRIGLAPGLNVFAWGLVVTNLAFLAPLVAVHAITRVRFGQAMADRAAWCLALAPPAVYASMVDTDGITLALAAGAGYGALRQRWLLAGLAGAGAALMRPPGLVIALLVGLIALMEADVSWWNRIRRAALGVVPGILAVAMFFGWMQVERGSWRLPSLAEQAWARPALNIHILSSLWTTSYRIVAYPIQHPYPNLVQWMGWSANARDLVFAIILLALVAWLWRSERTWRSPLGRVRDGRGAGPVRQRRGQSDHALRPDRVPADLARRRVGRAWRPAARSRPCRRRRRGDDRLQLHYTAP